MRRFAPDALSERVYKRFPARRWPSPRPTRTKSGSKTAPKRLKSPDAGHGFAVRDRSPRRPAPSGLVDAVVDRVFAASNVLDFAASNVLDDEALRAGRAQRARLQALPRPPLALAAPDANEIGIENGAQAIEIA